LAGNKPDEVEKKAAAIAEEVFAILTQPSDKLTQEYRGKFLKPAGKQMSRKATA
jgi:hypothetical protein